MQIALSQKFLSALAALPEKIQKRTREQIQLFQSNPENSGLHYEKLNMPDAQFRSFRVTDDYRVIVYHPISGDTYILLHVDSHDDAYDWSRRHRMNVNPVTGALQILNLDYARSLKPEPEKQESEPTGLFKDVKDKHLLRMGVPQILMPAIRNIQAEWELDEIQDHLPQEAAEALFMIAAGYTVEDTINEIEFRQPAPESVNTEDIDQALRNPESERRFHLVSDEKEMAEILNAPLEQWRVFLHPSQKKMVTLNANGPVRVLGGAGTGKTVVAMHRAKWLAENHLEADQNVLFTTFTVNLAADIEENLKKICSPETLKRIEVTSIDRWLNQYLKSKDYPNKIVYEDTTGHYWEEVLAGRDELKFSREFILDEWAYVIQNQGIGTEKEYLRAPRPARGSRLNRKDRKDLWQVFQDYRRKLADQGKREIADAARDARILMASDPSSGQYGAIVVDEAQDITPEMFRLLRSIIPFDENEKGQKNDLFIVGDGYQQIYKNYLRLSHCNIHIRGRNRSFRLKLNYRTTDEIRRWAVAIVENRNMKDLDGEVDTQKGYKSLMHGDKPQYQFLKGLEEEHEAVLNIVRNLSDADKRQTCIVARTKETLEDYQKELEKAGIQTHWIRRSGVDKESIPGVRLATMHRVKGLEFVNVILVGVQKGQVPPEIVAGLEKDEAQMNENRERSLLYVSATRAKAKLWVMGWGEPCVWLGS